MKREQLDFVTEVGDDQTGEERFRVLPETAYSIRVSMVPSHARFNLPDAGAVLKLLTEMVKSTEGTR